MLFGVSMTNLTIASTQSECELWNAATWSKNIISYSFHLYLSKHRVRWCAGAGVRSIL